MSRIVDSMLKRKLLLSGRIGLDSTSRLDISVTVHESPVSSDEYGRLWAAYHVRLLESLGHPASVDALLAQATIEKIIAKPFGFSTDCFERAGFSEVVQYTEDSSAGQYHIDVKYYGQKLRRFLVADLPVDVDSKNLIYGSVGLLQYSLNRCGREKETLDLIFELARNVVLLLKSGSGYEPGKLSQVPEAAYSLAKRYCGQG